MSDPVRVRTRFFGVYADLASTRDRVVELPAGSTTSDLVEALRTEGLGWIPGRVVVAVNQRYAEAPVPLSEGDEVALIPPVAGG